MPLIRRVALLVLFLGFLLPLGRATSIDPWLWEQFSDGADFVGVVECTVAGGIVAHYKVHERWKGEVEVGATVAIRIASDIYGSRYPVVLVGERFLVTVFRSRKPEWVPRRDLLHGQLPVEWRQVPADYYTPLFMGMVRLDANAGPYDRGFDRVGSKGTTLEDVRQDFARLVALPPEERAVQVVRALGRKYLSGNTFDRKPLASLGKIIADAPDHESLTQALLTAWDQSDGSIRQTVQRVVEQAPTVTRQRLVALLPSPGDETYTVKPGDTLHAIAKRFFGPEGSSYTIFEANRDAVSAPSELRVGTVLALRRRQMLLFAATQRDVVWPQEPETKAIEPTPELLERLRAALRNAPPFSPEFTAAADILIRYDPAPVIRWLRAWRDPQEQLSEVDRGYAVGSWAAVNCGKDRLVHLSSLLEAAEPLVRVAAAVHLAYEDEARGREALRRFSVLPGNAGMWAAVTLARRGDRAALLRAVEVLEPVTGGPVPPVVLRATLAARVLEVLSNTAAGGGMPTPVWRVEPGAKAQAESFIAAHPSLIPVDPWLPLLREQKID